jgi:hypothetical protein
MKDKYDLAIEDLTANPHNIKNSWAIGEALFQFVTLDGNANMQDIGVGCLTTIMSSECRAGIHPDVDDKLTQEIQGDQRLPTKSDFITVEHLPVFAEWQRVLDVLREKYKSQNNEQ